LNDFVEFTAGDIQKGFGVAYYSLTLERLGSTAASAFATLGFRLEGSNQEGI
jgi:hypothetical protein